MSNNIEIILDLDSLESKRPITRYIEKHSKVSPDFGMFSIDSCSEFVQPMANKPLELPF